VKANAAKASGAKASGAKANGAKANGAKESGSKSAGAVKTGAAGGGAKGAAKSDATAPVGNMPVDSAPVNSVSPKTVPQAGSADVGTGAGAGSGGSGVAASATRWVLLLVAGGLGVVVGTIGSFAHRATATVAGVAWPTGLFFAFCGLVGLLLGLGELLAAGPATSWRPSRLAGLSCAAAGWLIALLWLTYLGPPPSAARKGDVVLANDWRSLAYLFGGMMLATAAVYRAWVANLNVRLAAHSNHPKR
jgi:hypothetical protein